MDSKILFVIIGIVGLIVGFVVGRIYENYTICKAVGDDFEGNLEQQLHELEIKNEKEDI